jgi:hypothetical protein
MNVISAPVTKLPAEQDELLRWEDAATYLGYLSLAFKGYIQNRSDFPKVRFATGFGREPHYRKHELDAWRQAQQKEATS